MWVFRMQFVLGTVLNSAIHSVNRHFCELDRRWLTNSLDQVRRDDHRLHKWEKPGTFARASGSAVFTISRNESRCTREIPVLANGGTRYLDPYTRILTEEFTPVQCDSPFVPVFHTNGSWFKVNPSANVVQQPPRLSVSSRLPKRPVSFHHLFSEGVCRTQSVCSIFPC